jgi:CRISPR/Cas system-associated protein Csm6
MRLGVHLGPFWVSFGGRRRRKRGRRPASSALTPAEQQALERDERDQMEELAERWRIAAMTPEEHGRHLGMSEDESARALFKLTAEDRQQADAELQRLRRQMGYRDQD